MKVTVEDMHQHVISLCHQHGVAYTWCRRPTSSWAWFDGEEVCIAPIKSPISYAVALHEIGHVLGRYQQSKDLMVRERWAWQWARRNALMWKPIMDRHAEVSLSFAGSRLRITPLSATVTCGGMRRKRPQLSLTVVAIGSGN